MTSNAEWLLVAGSQFLNKPAPNNDQTECGRIFSELVKTAATAAPEVAADADELLSMLGKPHATAEEQDRMIVLAVLLGSALPESAVNAADFAILKVMRPGVGLDLRYIATGALPASSTSTH
ncbi:hypothetical protein HK414_12985 [Ramlibacter terrae]|uniref:Uncharacterized protein n=1 Tax=Ramlibacter terrae TaxID=2732511 RepID=A0ABX6P2M0_9BURK|nr:hypothetical protein HK414_12985 [Ramlibacter terrae]